MAGDFNPRLKKIQELRASMHIPQRPSLLELLDDTLEILEDIETRLRYMERSHEDSD